MDETQTTGASVPAQADTTDNQISEANVGNTETPEAIQDQAPAQEAVAPETKAEDTVEEKLYAGKYKTVEDMERAYSELNSKFTNTAQEKAELARILDEAFYAPEPAQVQEPQYGYQDDVPQANPEMERLVRDNAVNKFMLLHGDADAQAMKEILSADPLVSQIPSHEAKLEYAYQKSLNLSRDKAVAQARTEGAQLAQAKTAEKQVAQVEDAKKSAPQSNKADLIERMRYGDRSARSEVISQIPAVQEMRRMAGLE